MGLLVGFAVGVDVGIFVGLIVGLFVSFDDGDEVEVIVGIRDVEVEGLNDGEYVGLMVGFAVRDDWGLLVIGRVVDLRVGA